MHQENHQVLGRYAGAQLAIDADAHGARQTVDQGLRGQDVLDLGSADAEAERAQGAVGRRVAVAAQDHHARQDHAVLGRDHMLDALQRIPRVEQGDALAVAVALEIARLQGRVRLGDLARLAGHGVRGDDMVDHGHLLPGAQHLPPPGSQAAESLRTGVLVHDVQIDVEQHVLLVQGLDHMALHQFVVERQAWHEKTLWPARCRRVINWRKCPPSSRYRPSV
ncbi:hypothetical protein L543_0196 [Bordetella hinzii L60]|nr:hypothetical protein L543_0196 [Bordetella hinzii L60]